MATEAVPAESQPSPQEQELAALGALVVVVLSAQQAGTGALQVGQVVALLAPLGVAADVAKVAALLALGLAVLPPGPGVAERQVARTGPARRAAFLLNAARRMNAGGTLEAERRFAAQHLAGERARADAARRVDVAAGRWGGTLSWVSRLDLATTPGCRSAHGKLFRADTPPLIEGQRAWPGQIHGGACRCKPGPMIPGAPFLP